MAHYFYKKDDYHFGKVCKLYKKAKLLLKF